MPRPTRRPLVSLTVLAGLTAPAFAFAAPGALASAEFAVPPVLSKGVVAKPAKYFAHKASFYTQSNLPEGSEDPTSAEIIAFSKDKKTLVYTDAFTGSLGFVDTSKFTDPQPAGLLELPGDPTSVAIVGRRALVAVATNTDPDGDGPLNEFDNPSGDLLVIDLATRSIERSIGLSGQPDAVAVAPSGDYAAIAIENERDEDENGGLLPQAPAGSLQVLDLDGGVDEWALRSVDLTGLAETGPTDPEPEYVDINSRDRAVVTLQENNHLVVVNLRKARVINDFSAGTVSLGQIDTVEEEIGPDEAGDLQLTGSLTDRRREPDAVQWVDDDTFATANEGDYEDELGVEGGTRGFTLFNVDGSVEYDAGNDFEHRIVAAGHYPEGRSENKGSEAEGLEVARVGKRTYVLVGAERANIVGVYEMKGRKPVFREFLPTGIGPEGLVAAGKKLAISAEVDGFDDGFAARAFITFSKLVKAKRPAYPMLASKVRPGEAPVPWTAQSGLGADPGKANVVWSVSDSFLGQAYAYKIRTDKVPARVVKRVAVGAPGRYDLEGISVREDGGFWMVSEGNNETRENLLLSVDRQGAVVGEVPLPSALAAEATSSGFEGVTTIGTGTEEEIYIAIQREWADDEPGQVKIAKFSDDAWTFANYPLDAPSSPAGGWVGLSEITALPNGKLAVVERDNQLGLEARVKRLYVVDPESVSFAEYGASRETLSKKLRLDLLAPLAAASVTVPDKAEGFAVDRKGRWWLSTDNDGVDENYGETVFLRLR